MVDHKTLQPGNYVRFIGCPKLSYGTIVEHCPDRGGYLVQPEGESRGYGFGYQEIEFISEGRPRTRWQLIQDELV